MRKTWATSLSDTDNERADKIMARLKVPNRCKFVKAAMMDFIRKFEKQSVK